MKQTDETNSRSHIGRRLFLKGVSLAGLFACLPRAVWSFFVDELQVRTEEKENFRFDPKRGSIEWTGKASEPYYLVVGGLVGQPARLSYADLRSLPLVKQVSDFHCVEGWSVKDIVWEGFRFDEIVKRVKPEPDARYVIFHALGETSSRPQGLGHYRECLSLKELLEPKNSCLLALSMNGRLLPHDHGAPLRCIVPFHLGYKGTKFVSRIEFTDRSEPGWWTLANPVYPVDAPVPEERLRRKKQ